MNSFSILMTIGMMTVGTLMIIGGVALGILVFVMGAGLTYLLCYYEKKEREGRME